MYKNSTKTPVLDYEPAAISKPDPSYGVIAYIDIDWRQLTINGKACVKMDEVDVWWDHQDTTINISDREVVLSQKGKDAYGNNYLGQGVTRYPTSNSVSYSNPYPSSWVAVLDQTASLVGANSYCVLKRGSSVWDLYLNFKIL